MPGLRERKRLATRRRIADAARTMALEVGLENTTIDAVAAAADIAPRTFFNHFESKEDAVLGLEQVDLDPDVVGAHVDALAGRPAADAVVALVFLVLGETFADAAARRSRREVLERFPQLLRRQMVHMTTTAEALAGAVRTLLERDPAWGPEAATPLAAEMLLGTCMAALRATVRSATATASTGSSPNTTAPDTTAPPTDQTDAELLRTRVTALIRDMARRIG